ncbi:MAG: hypothetical protein C5B46_02355 [Proteobacteria bacterium]|nr:MAG: hypothetical protein C5B46_02355 [Pseudomonadota bacterium]
MKDVSEKLREYRLQAQQFRRLAAQAQPQMRAQLEHMVQCYDKLIDAILIMPSTRKFRSSPTRSRRTRSKSRDWPDRYDEPAGC